MGPDFCPVSLVYVLFQFICLLFLIQNSFSGQISGRISGKRNRISGRIPDTKKGRISGATLVIIYVHEHTYYIVIHIEKIIITKSINFIFPANH